jgi:hypothetical protein
MALGLMALAAANVGSYIVQRKLHLPENTADGLSGFFMGTAIAIMLLGIWVNARHLHDKGKLR